MMRTRTHGHGVQETTPIVGSSASAVNIWPNGPSSNSIDVYSVLDIKLVVKCSEDRIAFLGEISC